MLLRVQVLLLVMLLLLLLWLVWLRLDWSAEDRSSKCCS